MKGIRWLLRILPVGLAVLLLGGLLVLVAVRVARTVESAGEVRVNHYQVVRPRVAGIVTAVRVEPGDVVRAGQVLFELQDYEFERQVLAARKDLRDARAQKLSLERQRRRLDDEIHPLEKARQVKTLSENRLEEQASGSRSRELELQKKRSEETHRRVEELHEAGLASAQALAEARYDKLQAEERYQQSRLEEQLAAERIADAEDGLDLLLAEHRRAVAALEDEGEQLELTIEQLTADLERLDEMAAQNVLRSEIDGVVVGDSAKDLLGRRVAPGEELASIIDLESVHFVTYVPEAAILKVRAGQTAQVELAALPKLTFDVFEGEVQKVAEEPQLEQANSMILYPVEVRLRQPWVVWEGNRFYLRGGMRGQAKIAYRDDVSLLRALYESLAGEPGLEPAGRRSATTVPELARAEGVNP